MTQSMRCLFLVYIATVLFLAPLPGALAQVGDYEDPNTYPGSWFRIAIGTDGKYLTGDGHGYNGGTWHYYPQTGWYRQWFYNQPYDPNREGYLNYEVYIRAVDPGRLTFAEVNFNWTTPEWSQLGLKRPPLPTDVPTAGEETRYMSSRLVYLVDNWYIGTIEPVYSHIIKEYNPEWISIDIRARNAYIFRGAKHECRDKQGACCNRLTGECTLTTEKDCPAPLEWLGPGTSCSECTPGTIGMDFGDAPDSYRTLSTSNGPRHVKAVGVFLGRTLDTESEAIPNSSASGDDAQGSDDEDGVVFTSPLLPGEPTTIAVTASTSGYLNAWIDFNQDGDFEDESEQVFSDELLGPGANDLSLRIPSTAALGTTYARFRFNTRGLLSWYGPAADGEVEDYRISMARQFEPQANSGKGGLKWSQTPQQFDAATPFIFNGWDEVSSLNLHQIVADDWECQDDSPVTGIQWWGSFEGWTQPMLPSDLPTAFHIAIWSDTPQTGAPKGSFGHPDTLVWETFCTRWTWNIAGHDSNPTGQSSETCFQFTCLLSQDQWFRPVLPQDKNDAFIPTVYWLSVAALYDTAAPMSAYPWGWTTRPQFSDSGAVRVSTIDASGTTGGTWPPSPGSRWLSGTRIEDAGAIAWDLAFELLTNRGSPAHDADLAPVYRFWSDTLGSHFYTISESEKDLLIREYADVWTFEGIAFYAYPPDRAPVGAKPVYRFWSDSLGRHFYTIREDEKQSLMETSANIWALEGVAWYAFD